MKTTILFLCLLFTISFGQLSAQIPAQEKYWVITDSIQLEFNSSGLPTVSTSAFRGSGKNCSAEYSDNSGFRCYTNGKIFWDNTDQPMQGSFVASTSYGNLSVNQTPFFLESELDTASLYCISISRNGTQIINSNYKLDKTQNNGLGAVISAITIPTDSIYGENFANPVIVRQGDGTGWWMLMHHVDCNYPNFADSTNTWQLWAFENDTFSGPSYQLIGERYFREFVNTDLTFNPAGTKLASASLPGILELYDFDRCTGLLANPMILSPRGEVQLNNIDTSIINSDHGQYFGCAFSPSGRFLYANSRDTVWQFDLEADNIPASSTVLWYDTLNIDSLNLGTMELGPDGRIYIGADDAYYRCTGQIDPTYIFNPPNQYNSWLAVVNYPDSVGVGCDFKRHGLYLGGRGSSGSLPRTYNTQLGVWVGSPCDPNTTGEAPSKEENVKLKVYPNPAHDKINITWPVLGGYSWALKTIAGVTVSSGIQQTGNTAISTATLPQGMYFLEVHSAKEMKVEKVIILSEK